MNKVFFQGAEAKITLSNKKILKDRIRKKYRLKELDEKIRKQRTKAEIKLLERSSKVIPVPKLIIKNDEKFRINMELIEGKKLSDFLKDFSEKIQFFIMEKIGENISKIHDIDVIHGDLTTSNMIFNEKEKKIYFLDFGLGFFSKKIEDKAVDLHLLKQALEAKHFENWENLFNKVLEGYKISKNFKQVIERFEKVESRGRYKEQY